MIQPAVLDQPIKASDSSSSGNSYWTIIIAVIVIVFLVGGALAAYYYYFDASSVSSATLTSTVTSTTTATATGISIQSINTSNVLPNSVRINFVMPTGTISANLSQRLASDTSVSDNVIVVPSISLPSTYVDVSNLLPSTAYIFTLQAVLLYSNTQSNITVTTSGLASSPTALIVTETQNNSLASFVLQFTPCLNDAGGYAFSYANPTGSTNFSTPTPLTQSAAITGINASTGLYSSPQINGLQLSTTYDFKISSTNLGGTTTSLIFPNIPTTTAVVPVQPNYARYSVSSVTSSSVLLQWALQSDATSYSISISPEVVSSSGQQLTGLTTNSITITSLTENQQYVFALTAVNSAGSSIPAYITQIINPVLELTPPTSVTATQPYAGLIKLTWTGPSQNPLPTSINPVHYNVFSSMDNGVTWVLDYQNYAFTTISTYTHSLSSSTLTSNSSYVFQVQAVNGVQTSGFSNSSSSMVVQIPIVLSSPGSLTINQAESSIYGTFSAVTGASSYIGTLTGTDGTNLTSTFTTTTFSFNLSPSSSVTYNLSMVAANGISANSPASTISIAGYHQGGAG